MSKLTGKELELALMDEQEKERTPEEKLRDKVENHINLSDMLLQAVLDVAERGREAMEAGVSDRGARFNVIIDLLEQYRERQLNVINSMYPKKARKAA